MKIGYRTPGLRDLSIREKLELARKLNLAAVEPRIDEICGEDKAREWKRLSKEIGVEVNSVGMDMNMCDPTHEEDNMRDLKQYLKWCKMAGIKIAFSRSLSPPPNISQEDTWRICTRMFLQAAQECQKEGIKFAIEADPPCFIQNLERVERLLEKVDHPNLYVNFDPTNYYLVGSDPLKVIEQLGKRMINGHIKDGVYRSDYRGETRIGYGDVDYREIFQAMKDKDIQITMHIEHCKTKGEVSSAANYVFKILKELK